MSASARIVFNKIEDCKQTIENNININININNRINDWGEFEANENGNIIQKIEDNKNCAIVSTGSAGYKINNNFLKLYNDDSYFLGIKNELQNIINNDEKKQQNYQIIDNIYICMDTNNNSKYAIASRGMSAFQKNKKTIDRYISNQKILISLFFDEKILEYLSI